MASFKDKKEKLRDLKCLVQGHELQLDCLDGQVS